MLKHKLGRLLAYITSQLIFVLQRGDRIYWHRDELRQVKFSFSQFGEDIVVYNYLKRFNPQDGIYIDVGAFDPITFSNTLLLYKKGWHGINIDLDDDKIKKFQSHRPEDFNVKAAVSNGYTKMNLLHYSASTTDRIVSTEEINLTSVIGEKPLKISEIVTYPLIDIIESSPFKGKSIHYLNIDCEGHDFEVLKSLNLEKYKPMIITIESLESSSFGELEAYLNNWDYVLSDSIGITKIFLNRSREKPIRSFQAQKIC